MIQSVMPLYDRLKLSFDKGEGVWLYDSEGKRYLDCSSGFAVVAFGHCHPKLVEALEKQSKKLWHVSNLYEIRQQKVLADKLIENSFADSSFFVNSGTEAWELGMKMGRKYFNTHGLHHKTDMICLEGAFHGRSIAAISASGKEKLVKGFEPIIAGFTQVPPNDIEALKLAITDRTGIICVEPVMGEGGIIPLTAEYMQTIRSLCDEHDILMMVDEVQSGMGRTGKLFAYEWSGIEPDIMALAKGIGGGFPLGATVATERVASAMTQGSHGTTYGGNPLAMAVGNAAVDLMLEEGFLSHVQEMAQSLNTVLSDLCDQYPQFFKEVRGAGLMQGLQCQGNFLNTDLVDKLAYEFQLLTVPAADNVIRLLPPLIIEQDHIDLIAEKLAKALSELSSAQ